jgi:hypothetical protein
MFTPTKDEIFADLKWKAEHLQSRGYYLDKTVIQLMEYLCEHGEVPYQSKIDLVRKSKQNRGSKKERLDPPDTSGLPDLPDDA